MKFRQILEFSKFAGALQDFFKDVQVKKISEKDVLMWAKRKRTNSVLDTLEKKYDVNKKDVRDHIVDNRSILIRK